MATAPPMGPPQASPMTSCPTTGEIESSKQPAVGPVFDTPSTDTTLGSN